MKSIFLLALLGLCMQSATRPTSKPSTTRPAPKDVFRYNPKAGVCENAAKQKGYNPVHVEALFGVTLAVAQPDSFQPKKSYSHVDAECVDFRAFNFNPIVKLQYTNLDHWNLRGAQFDGAKLFFARIRNADLRGAKLKGLKFGYTTIDGQTDSFTTYPDFFCQIEKDKRTLSCRK